MNNETDNLQNVPLEQSEENKPQERKIKETDGVIGDIVVKK